MTEVQLFSAKGMFAVNGTLGDELAKALRMATERLEDWDADELLQTPTEDVTEALTELASIECPTLTTDAAYLLEPTEVDRTYLDVDRPRKRRVLRMVLAVPFTGRREVFLWRADQYSNLPPRVSELTDGEVRLAIDDPPGDAEAVRSAFQQSISNIEECLQWSRNQIQEHHRRMAEAIPAMVERRREELLAARNLQAAIGYPIKRRDGADTFAVPMKRRTVRPVSDEPRSDDARKPFKPEPAMGDRDFRDALRILRAARNQLERSPSVASRLDEESIRDLLLVGLNSHFEGAAGGELFNGEGKTDILIRVNDRSVFIGECKVWSGPKTIDEALTQLFRYLVWRDTKAALLLFIRRSNVSDVVTKAVSRIEAHPNFKRRHPVDEDDDHLEFVVHATDDPKREIRLVLLPFALRAVEK